jgi:DNA-directed RNA polymerase specialized sigma24 family protein
MLDKEIAERLGIPAGTVASAGHRALKKVQQAMSSQN